MARRRFGADLAAVVWRTITVADADGVVQLAPGVSGITAWNTEVSGAQVTDLQDQTGTPVTTITADAFGVLDFFGPDTDPETVVLWLDAGAGTRQAIIASDLGPQVIANATLLATLQAAQAGYLPATIADAKGDLLAATAADTLARLPVGANGLVLLADSAQAAGVKWAPATREQSWFLATPAVGVGAFSWRNLTGSALVVKRVCAQLGVAPVGGTGVRVDVNVSGTTVFTDQTQRPLIAAGATQSSVVTSIGAPSVPAGAVVTVDVDSVGGSGNTSPGSSLVVQVEMAAA